MQYEIILADPPWKYNERNNPNTRFGAGASYKKLSHEQLAALPVKALANPQACLLFLWVTRPFAFDGMRLMQAWGFQYITEVFTWVKRNQKSNSYFFGTGHYSAHNTEGVLLGKFSGSRYMKPETLFSQLIQTPVYKGPEYEHSQKPPHVHNRIEKMYPNARKLELFARKEREGWTCLGNQISGNDISDDLKALIGK